MSSISLERYWAAAFFDSRDQETLNDMAAQARRQLIHQKQITREDLQRLQMKFPHLTQADR
jgi:3-oxoacyl-[acyl-carrier-protein] synthase III